MKERLIFSNRAKVFLLRCPAIVLPFLFIGLVFLSGCASVSANLGVVSAEGDIQEVNVYLEKGADINWQGYDGTTALMFAAQGGHASVTRILLDHGANVNLRDRDGDTALIIAAFRGNPDIVHALLEHGAEVNAKDNYD